MVCDCGISWFLQYQNGETVKGDSGVNVSEYDQEMPQSHTADPKHSTMRKKHKTFSKR